LRWAGSLHGEDGPSPLESPMDELQLIAETVGRVLESQGHETIRDALGDVDALEEAVDRLETYERFHPDRFDRRKLKSPAQTVCARR
jgi:hypothetical protein